MNRFSDEQFIHPGICAEVSQILLAAQYWGKGDRAAVERIFAYVMKITAVVSFLFFIAGSIIPGVLMRIFTNEQTLIEGGRIYLRTVSPAFLLTGISQVYLCILKNTGKAVKSSVISSVSVVVNMILNAIFIFGWLGLPEMGIAGGSISHSDCQSDRGGVVCY